MNAERSQKHKNIDMLTVAFCAAAYVNILAFFSVVASSQISPHSEPDSRFFLSGCKDSQKIAYAKFGGKNSRKSIKYSIFAG